MMLAHLGEVDAAERITKAVEKVAADSGSTVELGDKVVAAL